MWQKYDSVFCPEYKFGAMEHVGAITFSENYCFKGLTPTSFELTRFYNTVLHELCHQWFGNLVTMKWWNDLWLNEAFATYVSYICMEQKERVRSSYPALMLSLLVRKRLAYAYDNQPSTHPIVKDAPHTDSADDMVNAITYGKGSSFLKQLYHLIGNDTFSKGCKNYFAAHSWKNTQLPDFLTALC